MTKKRISRRFAHMSEAMHKARREIRKYGYVGAFERLFACVFRGAK